jgi:putative ABC transport system substrate-binding protein
MKAVLLLIGFVLGSIHFAQAQQPAKIPRIAYLSGNSPSANATRTKLFRQGLRKLGYIEGQNIVIEYRYAEGKLDRLPELAAELVRHKLDTIVAAGGMTVIRAAKSATQTIPIVMAGSGIDPVVAGLVESLAAQAATSLALRISAEN